MWNLNGVKGKKRAKDQRPGGRTTGSHRGGTCSETIDELYIIAKVVRWHSDEESLAYVLNHVSQISQRLRLALLKNCMQVASVQRAAREKD
jgi:hypothetical protein